MYLQNQTDNDLGSILAVCLCRMTSYFSFHGCFFFRLSQVGTKKRGTNTNDKTLNNRGDNNGNGD